MHLPPGPTQPPIVQTLRWLLRPISFLESCRRRFGDAFSVRFLGFQTPMVMLSDPEAIRALYTSAEHGLPPGRTLALRPILGARSLLLLEGREHLARRRLMLPPFHGERMRAYEATVREVVGAGRRDVAGRGAVRAAPAHAGGHARGDPARGVRRHRRRRGATRLARPARRAARRHRVGRPAVRRAARRGASAGRTRSTRAAGAAARDRRAAGRRDRRAPRRPARGHPVAARGGALRGRRADGRRRDPRPADDAAARRARDDGDRPGVDVRPAGPPPRRARAAGRRGRRGRATPTCARSSPSRCGCGRSCRWPAAGWRRRAARSTATCSRPAPTSRRRSGSPTRAPTATPSRSRSAPSASSTGAPATYAWIPFGGGVRRCIGAAFAEMEMRVALAEILRRERVRAASARPSASRAATSRSPRPAGPG